MENTDDLIITGPHNIREIKTLIEFAEAYNMKVYNEDLEDLQSVQDDPDMGELSGYIFIYPEKRLIKWYWEMIVPTEQKKASGDKKHFVNQILKIRRNDEDMLRKLRSDDG